MTVCHGASFYIPTPRVDTCVDNINNLGLQNKQLNNNIIIVSQDYTYYRNWHLNYVIAVVSLSE